MPSKNKPVIDINSFRVEVRDGVETAIANTYDGDVVGYYINKQGVLVAIADSLKERPQIDSWLSFRSYAKQRLGNPVIKKEFRSTTKVVDGNRSPSTKPVPNRKLWYREET